MFSARLARLKRKWLTNWFYLRYDDHAAYQRVVRMRIDDLGPNETIGGTDTGVGDLQFEFLRDHGLQPDDRLLDFGCGALRGGARYIEFLDTGRYVGVDMIRTLLSAGRDQLGEELLAAKRPALIVGDGLKVVASRSFDVAVAQSVLSHASKPQIRGFFEGIPEVLRDHGAFYITFFDEPRPRPQDIGHDPAWMRSVADECGLVATIFPANEYNHPYGQRMMALEKR